MKKRLIEDCLAWNINDLTRAGVFKAPTNTPSNCAWTAADGEEIFRLDFYMNGNIEAPRLCIVQKIEGLTRATTPDSIEIAFAPCHFGGQKRLFICPGNGGGTPCGRRAGKLYLVEGRWMCRKCGALTYSACRKHDRRLDALLRSPIDRVKHGSEINRTNQAGGIRLVLRASGS